MEINTFLRSQNWLSPIFSDEWLPSSSAQIVFDSGFLSIHNKNVGSRATFIQEKPLIFRTISRKRKIEEADSQV